MFRKMVLLSLLLGIFGGSLFAEEIEKPKSFVANGERYDFESFDQNKVPSLIKECFPGVTFYISRMFSLHLIGGPENGVEKIVAVFKGKKYWIAHFNKLWLDAAKDKKDLNKMLKSYVLLTYWRDTFYLKHYKEKLYYGKDGQIKAKRIPPKYNKIEVSDVRPISEKYGKISFHKKNYPYEITVKINNVSYTWIIRITNMQIERIITYKEGNYDYTISIPLYGKINNKDIHFSITSGNYLHETH